MSAPRLLDLFCGAGGAAMGYHRVGFEVVGVDIKPQPHYPFEFHQAEALEFLAQNAPIFDAFHASPPCQGYSKTRAIHGRVYPLLIPSIRHNFRFWRKPSVIENVVGAPLVNPIMLCGEMFGLRVIRHRLFECSWFCPQPHHPQHKGGTNAHRTYSTGAYYVCVAGHNFRRTEGAAAMGIDWMSRDELAQAIPPAYTEWIGRQLLQALVERRCK